MRAIRAAWRRISEPRHETVAYFVVYVVTASMALWALTEPPLTLLGELGPLITGSVALLLLVGALIAASATLPGWWALERVGIGFIVLGIGGYIIAVGYMHATSEGSRALQLTGLVLGVLLVLARAVRIWGRDWAPRGARIT